MVQLHLQSFLCLRHPHRLASLLLVLLERHTHEVVIAPACAQVLQSVNVNALLNANSETLPSSNTAMCATRQRSSNEGLGIHKEARANCVAQRSAWQGSLWAPIS